MSIIVELLPALLSLLAGAPGYIKDVEAIWALMTATEAPTAAQQRIFDYALEEAHKALQDS